jgi:Tfp pilus assembly protein PilF
MKEKICNAVVLAVVLVALTVPVAPATAQDIGTGDSSGNSSYHYSLGTSLMLDGKYAEAAREYEKALSLDPKSAFLASELATLYVKMGELDRALSVCEQSLVHNPTRWKPTATWGASTSSRRTTTRPSGPTSA